MKDPNRLHTYLRCDPFAGKLYWRERAPEMFEGGASSAAKWNARFAGAEALYSPTGTGYLHGRLEGKAYRAHRVIWAMSHGEWPVQIDHVNGNREDNRLVNLRSVTNSINGKNQKRSSRNTSGVTGVSWDKYRSKWKAMMFVDGSNRSLGRFDDLEQARAARRAAETDVGFHPNHGSR